MCMKATLSTLLIALCIFVRCAQADSWEPPTKFEASSENGAFVFVVEPVSFDLDGDPPKKFQCRGSLFTNKDGKRELVWTRLLVNEIAPVGAKTSNDGCVVTFDEWHRIGTHPIVIYSVRGNLVVAHNMETLGLNAHLARMKRSVSSLWWRSGENDSSETMLSNTSLTMWLGWGHLLLVDLGTGEVMNEDWARGDELRQTWLKQEREAALKSLRESCDTKLKSEEVQVRCSGVKRIAALELRDRIPELKQLLSDTGHWKSVTTKGAERHTRIIYGVRKAAAEALKKFGEDPGEVVFEGPVTVTNK